MLLVFWLTKNCANNIVQGPDQRSDRYCTFLIAFLVLTTNPQIHKFFFGTSTFREILPLENFKQTIL